MVTGTFIIDVIKVIALVWFISAANQKTYHIGLACLITVCMLPGIAVCSSPFFIFCYRFLLGNAYVRIRGRQKFLQSIVLVFLIYFLAEAAYLFAVLAAYPFIVLFNIQSNAWIANGVIILLQGFFTVLLRFSIISKVSVFLRIMEKRLQIGIILLCSAFEFVFLTLVSSPFNSEYMMFYMILFFLILISILILIFWMIDKFEEREKINELTAYSHRTREIIPSLRRALMRTDLETAQLLEELRSICDVDQLESTQEFRSIKSFDSTGIIVLDEQLKRYLEEACQNNFELDIIVMTPINKVIFERQIERSKLLQIVGDIYRNAFRVIFKIKNGRILICFGFNSEDIYEISFYDNGEPFNEYIFNNLGKRGITTTGTGHGIADTLLALQSVNASFVIEQGLAKHSIFTKVVRIIFDGLGRVEIK